jgi:primosomal protein N' (replication factor Y)
MYIIISPFSNTFDEIWLIYFVPDFLKDRIKVWQIVEIPMKTKINIWVVLYFIQEKDINIKKEKIKSIITLKTDFVFLSKYQIKLISYISTYYFSKIHHCAKLFIPKNIRDKITKNKLEFLEKDLDNLDYTFNYEKKLTDIQNKAYKEIKISNNNKVLICWVTWSWKTEIYIKLIKDYLNNWKQSLFLIPEIILSNQIWMKIKKVFWEDVLVITWDITESTKTKYWNLIKKWKAKIILWTRSAIFYPYKNLWIIIVDEEHDLSYISDSSPRYNTIEVVSKISELLDIKIVLASWTPSIKSMYNWLKWKYNIINLLKKYK